MFQRRWSIATAIAAMLACSTGLVAQKKDEKKQDEAQKKEVQNLVKLADDATTGQPGPNDLAVTWVREDILKAQGNKQYIPFIVTVDASKIPGDTLAFYWRVVSKNAPVPTAVDSNGKKDDKKDKDYAYEDVAFVPVTSLTNATAPSVTTTSTTATSGNTTTTTATSTMNPGSPGQPTRVTQIKRSFTVPAGSYDVYVVAKEPTSTQKNAPPPKTSILKQTVTVPDFWNGELNTSTVIVAQRIDPLPAPLTPQQQADRPYALGQMEIVPQTDFVFSKKQELSTFMLIYNPTTDKANKPDVVVEYNFYAKTGGDWKFFNKTNPQSLNAQTLPPEFDIAAGHQLQSGQAVPLASFPEGDYRLEIKVTDKLANKTLTRDVNFTVTAS